MKAPPPGLAPPSSVCYSRPCACASSASVCGRGSLARRLSVVQMKTDLFWLSIRAPAAQVELHLRSVSPLAYSVFTSSPSSRSTWLAPRAGDVGERVPVPKVLGARASKMQRKVEGTGSRRAFCNLRKPRSRSRSVTNTTGQFLLHPWGRVGRVSL